MPKNLEVELVRMGYKQNQIPKLLARTIGCAEKTIRNKLDGVSAFTVPEAVIIHKDVFNYKNTIEFLFDDATENDSPPKAG